MLNTAEECFSDFSNIGVRIFKCSTSRECWLFTAWKTSQSVIGVRYFQFSKQFVFALRKPEETAIARPVRALVRVYVFPAWVKKRFARGRRRVKISRRYFYGQRASRTRFFPSNQPLAKRAVTLLLLYRIHGLCNEYSLFTAINYERERILPHYCRNRFRKR